VGGTYAGSVPSNYAPGNKITETMLDGQFFVVIFYFILAQSGKILAQFLCKNFILLYFILLQMGEAL